MYNRNEIDYVFQYLLILANAAGYYKAEITPMEIKGKKGK